MSAPRFAGELSRQNLAGFAAFAAAALFTVLWQMFGDAPGGEGSLWTDGRFDAEVLFWTAIPTYLVFWNAFALVYGWITHRVYGRMDVRTLQRVSADQHRRTSSWALRLLGVASAESWTVAGAMLSALFTISIAQTPSFRESPLTIALGLGALASSWALMVYSYAQRYARLAAVGHRFDFPIDEEPRFGDYLTMSILTTTLIGSGVRPHDSAAWSTMRTHVLLAFAFNTVIVAMTVSLLFGGLLS